MQHCQQLMLFLAPYSTSTDVCPGKFFQSYKFKAFLHTQTDDANAILCTMNIKSS